MGTDACTAGPGKGLIENMKQGLESERTPEESVEYQVNHKYPLELPLVVSNGQLNTRALREVKPIHLPWKGFYYCGRV